MLLLNINKPLTELDYRKKKYRNHIRQNTPIRKKKKMVCYPLLKAYICPFVDQH